MKHLINYLKAAVRLSINHNDYEKVVWESLKKYFSDNKYKFGVYESDKRIEALFTVSEETALNFFYIVSRGSLRYSAKVLNHYPPELATDIFVMASHFNNVLKDGVVVVYPNELCVEFQMKSDCTLNIIWPIILHDYFVTHCDAAKDMFWAFNKLVEEREEPAIIIADLFRMKESNEQSHN